MSPSPASPGVRLPQPRAFARTLPSVSPGGPGLPSGLSRPPAPFALPASPLQSVILALFTPGPRAPQGFTTWLNAGQRPPWPSLDRGMGTWTVPLEPCVCRGVPPHESWGLKYVGACGWARAEGRGHPHSGPGVTGGLHAACMPLFGGGRCAWWAWLVSCPLIPADRGAQVGSGGAGSSTRPTPSGASSCSAPLDPGGAA